ncbi:MAG: DNA internalization-related competence protein ComEC/Rec2 [Clostridia bacterium]|nr:DNA internalization-related competence protein ComEC/Rec2 [Clostridia bacterium]
MSVRPFHHQRPLVCLALTYGLGVGAGVSFAWRPGLYALGLLLSAAAAALLFRDEGKRTLCLMGGFLFLGALLGGWHSHPVLPPEGQYHVTGVLSCDANLRENGTAAAYLEDARIQTETGDIPVGRLYWTYTPEEALPFLPKEGDRISFSAKLYHPQGQVNPFGFDFRMYLLQSGVSLGVSGAQNPEMPGHPGRGLASLFFHLRQTLTERLRLIFGADSALPEALLLGQREQLPEETTRGFSDAGAAHLLAVSGLHVGLLAGLLIFFLRRLLSPKRRMAVLGFFLLAYCALLEFHAPVVRAVILLLLASWRRVVRRAPDMLTTLSATFFLMLLLRPLDLFSASFQLSFCAVLGIVVFLRGKNSGARNPLINNWKTTFAATAGVTLPTVQIFHRLSIIGLAVNPLLIAVFSVLLPVYLAVFMVGCVSLSAGMLLAGWVNPVTRGLIGAVTWLGSLPFASIRVPYLPWYCVCAAAFAFVMASGYVVWPGKLKAMAAGLALLLAFGCWQLTVCRDVRYIQLAMGQSDSAIITDGAETVLIDTGSNGGDVASYLLSNGRNADTVILTHLHSDHCMGITQLLKERVPIGKVYLPEGAEEQQVDAQCLELLEELEARGIPICHIAAGDEIRLPRSVLTVAWPIFGTVRPGQDANRYSLCLLCDLDGVRLLTTGDLTGDYELYAARDADILKVAHHGSKYSMGDNFLDAVTPQIALITASRNSASLPHPDTLARLSERGIPIYATGRTGAVTITIKDGEAVLIPFLNEK